MQSCWSSDRLNIELASEFFTRTMSLVNAASGRIELDGEIKERLAIHVGRFFSLTEDALLTGLRAEDTAIWETVAGILLRLGKTGLLGDLVSTVIVRPPLEALLSKPAFEEARRRTGPSQAIDSLFEGLFTFIKQVRARWFERLLDGHPGTTLFVDSVLVHIFTGLTRNLSVIFSPAIPDTFHRVDGLRWPQVIMPLTRDHANVELYRQLRLYREGRRPAHPTRAGRPGWPRVLQGVRWLLATQRLLSAPVSIPLLCLALFRLMWAV